MTGDKEERRGRKTQKRKKKKRFVIFILFFVDLLTGITISNLGLRRRDKKAKKGHKVAKQLSLTGDELTKSSIFIF